ncbi:hypothetical protein Acid7E03_43010 [Acidisoma sp. 7E03]
MDTRFRRTEAHLHQLDLAQSAVTRAVSELQDQITSLRLDRAAEQETLNNTLYPLTQRLSAITDFQLRLDSSDAKLATLTAELAEKQAFFLGQLSLKDAEIAGLKEKAAAEESAWRHRVLRLETLLIESPVGQAAGVHHAVACLPDPAVAVILPTYNRRAILGDAIASVQAQSFRSWELVIVDDGSSDDLTVTLDPFLADPRIRMVRQPRGGAAAARNRGLVETSAPLIAYIDSDNVWYPNFLARAVDCLAREPEVDLVYGALVTDDHNLDQTRILWSPFDRGALLAGNFIDTSSLVHRRSLVDAYGGWDAALRRLLDWDLVLRYTVDKPAKPIPVIAAHYRRCDDERITSLVPYGPDDIVIRNKWFPPPSPPRRPRVLYVVWHYPHSRESAVEMELQCVRSWGVTVAVWRSGPGTPRDPGGTPIHDGSLAQAIAMVQPDVIHVHTLRLAQDQRACLVEAGLPVTVRLEDCEATPPDIAAWLNQVHARAVYASPQQIAVIGVSDPRLVPLPVAFESAACRLSDQKDHRLVVGLSPGLPRKGSDLFLETAERFPHHRFVLWAGSDLRGEHYANAWAADGQDGPAGTRLTDPRDDLSALVGAASICVHTIDPTGDEAATAVGQASPVVAAMATGCYCLVADVSPLAALIGDAGATYRDIDEASELIRTTEAWTEEMWCAARHRAIERAWLSHADKMVFRRLFEDWTALIVEKDHRASAHVR